MSREILTVGDLLDALSIYPPSADVLATWEGQTLRMWLYEAADGTVLLDSDGCSDMDDYISGKRTVDHHEPYVEPEPVHMVVLQDRIVEIKDEDGR